MRWVEVGAACAADESVDFWVAAHLMASCLRHSVEVTCYCYSCLRVSCCKNCSAVRRGGTCAVTLALAMLQKAHHVQLIGLDVCQGLSVRCEG